MKLTASLIVRNELGRYLEPCLDHLAEFCDAIVVLDDASTDGTYEALMANGSVTRLMRPTDGNPTFDAHEGTARQALLDLTLAEGPTHVLAIDADEFVEDGPALRATLERDPSGQAWSLTMCEIWEIDGDCLCIREDGGWREHDTPMVYAVPPAARRAPGQWRIPDRKLASGRVPVAVAQAVRCRKTGIAVLHFGWANPATRQARHDRYVQLDGGRYHAGAHLDSIAAPPDRVQLRGSGWPTGLLGYRDRIRQAAGVSCAT